MTIDVPILPGTGWILAVLVGISVVMIVKWVIDILP